MKAWNVAQRSDGIIRRFDPVIALRSIPGFHLLLFVRALVNTVRVGFMRRIGSVLALSRVTGSRIRVGYGHRLGVCCCGYDILR